MNLNVLLPGHKGDPSLNRYALLDALLVGGDVALVRAAVVVLGCNAVRLRGPA